MMLCQSKDIEKKKKKKIELSKDTQEMKKLNYLRTFKGCYMSTKD